MRYPASEKLEIIRLVEQSHLPARRTLEKLGIPRRTFYRWYDNYLGGGPEALADRPSTPGRVWNRVPGDIHDQIIKLALEQSELSPRELAVRFTDEKRYFVSEATDPAPIKMFETIINLKPKNEWRPGVTNGSLKTETDQALQFPGVSDAWTMPIRARIDMLSTGIRTPVIDAGAESHRARERSIGRIASRSVWF
jgi:hypothetical protein